jgi:hypothetical protein
VFSRALSVDPRQRYRTMGELAAAFDAAANQQQSAGATLAFPAVDAMPPPGPGAGPQYSPATQIPPTQVSGQQGQPGQWAGQSSGQGGMSGPTLPSAGMPEAHPAAAAAALTMVPMAAEGPRARARASRVVPIFLGIMMAVLIGGAVAAFVFLGNDQGSGAATTGTAITVPPPSAATTATEAPSTAPTPTATTTATADAPAAEVQLKIACVPGCDSLQVDGKAVEEITKPAKVTAGKHTLSAAKEGYTPFEETVEVEISGKEAKVTFTREGSPAQTAQVKDLTKPLDHKVALALQPKAATSTAPTTTASSTATKTGGTSTGTSTKKPPCKSKFGVGCK